MVVQDGGNIPAPVTVPVARVGAVSGINTRIARPCVPGANAVTRGTRPL
jgi:hypothetical protein